ncbi:unnamed protein product [Rotaria magnacalcarata]|uniref:EF-hand domain-containing protein n=1 Tax=Rotaria magnacalcarata TaxID=392030 RepID=A0A816YPY5_9BILA|nr:unnamed protein product [Rotaria magnacalcarata]CAF2159972.1 unnamed protein product [Rotaria magnacalcarata]CAF3866327.1 unnamed protein product [Rotaria magnacalcarata]CAF3880546.1 unnamed protein product [Rotaria magnacalcarata]
MEKLVNLTEADINNGVLTRMLANAGIPDVQQYVKHFNRDVEEIVVEEFKHSDRHESSNEEQSAPPIDMQSWITSLIPRLDEPIKSTEPQKHQPTDLHSWMQSMVSSDQQAPVDSTPSQTINSSSDSPAVTGNIGTWLHNWSTSLTEQPPPKSLDEWLKSLVSENMNESIGKEASSKGRLNIYLDAAEKVLSGYGYDVSSASKPSTTVQAKTGVLGNVKQMYFLWKTLDKNNDRKITVEDVQIMLAEMGLGFLSKYVAKALFDMVDSNHDGQLQFRDFIALMGIIKKLLSAVASAKTA